MPPGAPPAPPQGSGFQRQARPSVLRPQVLVSTPHPTPPGPSPCSHFLIWVYHTGRKRRNFPFRPVWGKGSPPDSGGVQSPSKAHLLAQATPPAPPPQLPRLPAPPSRKGAQRLPGLWPDWEGAARKLQQAGWVEAGEGGALGAEEGAE